MNLSNLSTKLNIIRRRFSPYKKTVITVTGIAVIGLVFFSAVKFLSPLLKSAGTLISQPFTTLNILKNPTQALDETNGYTNILILGKGGAAHEAPDLTDTIIIISLRHSDRQFFMISLPRDIWITSMQAKINTAYYYGQQKNPDGGGLTLARDAVFQVTDLPIHYTVLVDFTGFVKAIDLVNGVDIEVQRSFTDEKYPIESLNGDKPNNSEPLYQTLHFEKGLQHFDGAAALQFSRSRNSEDPQEGTDFARANRQQQVLIALTKKIKTKETALNAERILDLRQLFNDYTETDLGDQELLALGKIGLNIELDKINHIILDVGTKENPGLLTNPPTYQYGQWVLIPRSGNWQQTHDFINQELSPN